MEKKKGGSLNASHGLSSSDQFREHRRLILRVGKKDYLTRRFNIYKRSVPSVLGSQFLVGEQLTNVEHSVPAEGELNK